MLHSNQLEALCPIGAYPPGSLSESTNEIGQAYNLLEIQQIVYQYGALLSVIPSGQLIPQSPPAPTVNSDNAPDTSSPSANCLLEHWSIISLIPSSPYYQGPRQFYFFLTGASIFGMSGFLYITQLPTQFPVFVFIPLSNIAGINCYI